MRKMIKICIGFLFELTIEGILERNQNEIIIWYD